MRKLAPRSAHSTCHGTRLAWCSSALTTTASPGPIAPRPQAWATRLMAAVVPLVNTISSVVPPIQRATAARAASKAAVAASDSAWTPRWTLPASTVKTRTTASITACGLSVVEALSRYARRRPWTGTASAGKS